MTPARLERIAVRGIDIAVRHWGDPAAPALFLLHGWMDTSATFQFVVDALDGDWHLIAPDWRGYGDSTWLGRPYWFPDYYADLDAVLAHYSPAAPATLIGHSMGASVAAGYAGARPDRVARLAMIDFLGLPASTLDDATPQLTAWLEAQAGTHRLRPYPDPAALARRLMASNPRLTAARADFLARHTSRQAADGTVTLACDPWHKVASPVRYQVEDSLALWRAIRCPVLHVFADQGYVHERFGTDSPELHRRLSAFHDVRVDWIADAGHNVQHDQPAALAAALATFLRQMPEGQTASPHSAS